MPAKRQHSRRGVLAQAGATVADRDAIKPFRDRWVDTRTVPCPDCKAEVGEKCNTTNHKPHPVRRRMAVRLLNEEELG